MHLEKVRIMCYTLLNNNSRRDFMNRNAYYKLVEWKNDPERKPLILKGARQVGKTSFICFPPITFMRKNL